MMSIRRDYITVCGIGIGMLVVKRAKGGRFATGKAYARVEGLYIPDTKVKALEHEACRAVLEGGAQVDVSQIRRPSIMERLFSLWL